MDVIAILKRSNHQVQDFNMKVTGEISKQAPIEYVAIHIVYEIKGNEYSKQAALDAVMASQEKYCGISHMLKKIIPVTWDVTYNDHLIFTNKKETILS